MGQTTHDKYYHGIRDRIGQAYSRGPGQGTSSHPSAGQAPGLLDLAALRRAVVEMQRSSASVGETPPEPPTFRGWIGAFIVRAMQRALFWYTPQIVQFHNAAVQAQEQQAQGLEAVTLAIHDIRTRWQEQAQADTITNEHAAEIERTWTDSGEQLSKLERRREGIEDRQAHLASLEREVADLKIRMYGETISRERDKEAAARRQTDWSRRLDEFYVRLEEEFRGSCQTIKERLSFYLPIVEQALAAKENAAILDIGCGRGEWLELLRDHGRDPLGIDGNHRMVRLCETKGLRAREGDGIDYLKSLPGGCLDVITAFHVIEHLPLQTMFELFAETLRVLSPTGVAIFETPNPKNQNVSAWTFYLDPTHRNPIPSELARLVAQTHGFEQVDIVDLNPAPEAYLVVPGDNAELTGRFNELFYGPRDYGMVAWKTRRLSGGTDAQV